MGQIQRRSLSDIRFGSNVNPKIQLSQLCENFGEIFKISDQITPTSDTLFDFPIQFRLHFGYIEGILITEVT